MNRSLHMWRQYLSPVCAETKTGKHFFITLTRTHHDPPDQVQMQCAHCGSAAYLQDHKELVIDLEDPDLPVAHAIYEALDSCGTRDFRVQRERIRAALRDFAITEAYKEAT